MRGYVVRTVTAAVLGTALVAISSACTSSTHGPTAVVVGAGESPILVEGTVFKFEDVKFVFRTNAG